MNCPECDARLGLYAKSCKCGWKSPELSAGIKSGDIDPAFGYIRCDFDSSSGRCRYPAVLSSGTSGRGPWRCSAHWSVPSPSIGAQIVAASMDYKHPTTEELLAEHQARADKFCAEKGLDTVEKKRAWVKENLRIKTV